jgi:hypothetical protein
LLSVLLALVLLATSLLVASAHETPEPSDDYGIVLTIDRTDDKESVKVGTELTFFITIERKGQHVVTFDASLATETAGGYGPERIGTVPADNLVPGGRSILTKLVKYTVRAPDLAGAARRLAPIQFTLTFTPEHSGGNRHDTGVTIKSNKVPVVVTKKGTTTTDEISELELFFDMDPPNRIAAGEKVTFELTVATGKYWLVRSKQLRIRKQLYDADGDEIGKETTARVLFIRPLRTESETEAMDYTYTLTKKDTEAARIDFHYELEITEDDLRDADGNDPNLDSDFEETFEWSGSIGQAARPTAAATPTVRPTPAPRVIERTSAVRVLERSRYAIRLDRRDGGADFNLNLGRLFPNGARQFTRSGYIRDADIYRGGQTYAVVRRESDHEVVRIWISPESPERNDVPWSVVNRSPFTVPVRVLSAIKLDETRPVENQLVRRFDAGGDGKIYVYRDGAWRWIPDLATFKSEGFYWCDVTAADVGFFGRALIGSPLPASGGADDPNYPSCHSK